MKFTRYGIVSRERSCWDGREWYYGLDFYESQEERDESLSSHDRPFTLEFELDVEAMFPPVPPEPTIQGEVAQ